MTSKIYLRPTAFVTHRLASMAGRALAGGMQQFFSAVEILGDGGSELVPVE